MKKFFITGRCIDCSACVNDCPVQAVEKISDKLQINQKICIGCGDCYEICPVGAIELRSVECGNKN